ncbi:MAG: hypothetical protein HOP08_02020 [Cyclobacteriaceae bacterium]|nr:hypothetical protein [Cyclobacteriaceae bacterium]
MKNMLSLYFKIGVLTFLCTNCRGQDVLHKKAMSYIEKDTVALKYMSEIIKSEPCVITGRGEAYTGPKNDKIVLSERVILNSPYSCLCDILQKKYGFTGKCTEEIGLDGKLATSVSDSINFEYRDYQFLPKGKQIEFVNQFVLEFSSVYKNTILANLMFVCSSKSIGTSISFYFIFDSSNHISQVYHGKIYKH